MELKHYFNDKLEKFRQNPNLSDWFFLVYELKGRVVEAIGKDGANLLRKMSDSLMEIPGIYHPNRYMIQRIGGSILSIRKNQLNIQSILWK